MRQAGEGKRLAIGTGPVPSITLNHPAHQPTRQDAAPPGSLWTNRGAAKTGMPQRHHPTHNQHPPGGPLRGGADRRPTAGPPLGTPLITVPSGIANARPTRQGSGTKPCPGGRIPPRTVRPPVIRTTGPASADVMRIPSSVRGRMDGNVLTTDPFRQDHPSRACQRRWEARASIGKAAAKSPGSPILEVRFAAPLPRKTRVPSTPNSAMCGKTVW